ncbi:HAD family hydrolase [Bacillaceae bacterium W0354]
MKIVTVDFDGTLYQGNSFKVMFDVGKKEYGIKEWFVLSIGAVKSIFTYIFKGKDKAKHTFFTEFAKSFKGKSQEELNKFFDALARQDLGRVNRPLVKKIKQHQENGDQIIILSGALMPFLHAFTNVINLDNVEIIGTELLYKDDGQASGKIGPIVNGELKAKAVRKWLANREVTEEDVTLWAYADSESDSPLFDMVDYPIVVNPDEDMEKLAEQRGWPVFEG